ALTREVLRAASLARLRVVAVVLLALGVLGSGAGLLARQAPAARTDPAPAAAEDQVAARVEDPATPEQGTRGGAGDDTPAAAAADRPPASPAPDDKSDPLPASGKVDRVDKDGNGFTLAVSSKGKGEVTRREIRLTENTRLVFSNVGPDEA